eukprot:3931604-Rhodomonas_salina.3
MSVEQRSWVSHAWVVSVEKSRICTSRPNSSTPCYGPDPECWHALRIAVRCSFALCPSRDRLCQSVTQTASTLPR